MSTQDQHSTPKRLAIVGTGISGLVAASILGRRHDITVFEAADYVGGHTNTVDVDWQGRSYSVDTGFIVFNDRTYPNFEGLLERLGVPSKPTTMSFSVRCERTGLEYNGSSLNQMFAQRRNLLRPSFYRMIRDILRFYREAPKLLEDVGRTDFDLTLGDYLERNRYSRMFVDQHIVPMGAAIWSADPGRMLEFPAVYFVRFFHNHGMLSVRDRPTWRVVEGGSRSYVPELIRPFADRIRLNSPVTSLRRTESGVSVEVAAGRDTQHFDGAVLACHSDQALRMLADPTRDEREVLSATPYQENDAVLHVDDRLMPKRRRAWAAWNYHVDREPTGRAAVTYNMNILQGIEAPVQFCLTLNRTGAIDPAKVVRRITYHHPAYTTRSPAAQARHGEVSGAHRVWFCGAYWGYGFHEDGVKSALAVCRQLGMDFEHSAVTA